MSRKFSIEEGDPGPPKVGAVGSFTISEDTEKLIASVLPFTATLQTLNEDLFPEEVSAEIRRDFSGDATIIGLMTTHEKIAILLIEESSEELPNGLTQFITVYGENVLSKLAKAGIRFINL